jgi:antitoxin PrlF
MKANVTITSRGVITLPAKLRQALGLKAEDHLIAETTPEGLLLRPAVTIPIEIYTAERVREFDAAEQELAVYLANKVPAKAPAVKRSARSKGARSNRDTTGR